MLFKKVVHLTQVTNLGGRNSCGIHVLFFNVMISVVLLTHLFLILVILSYSNFSQPV